MTALLHTNAVRPNIMFVFAQMHQQDWRPHHQAVFANIVALLTGDAVQDRIRPDIMLLQGWGDPVSGIPQSNSASDLGPEHRHQQHAEVKAQQTKKHS